MKHFLVIILLMGIVVLQPVSSQNYPLSVGAKAPAFNLKNVEGKEVGIKSYLGKWVVLVFYRGSWCSLCNKQLSKITDDYSKFQELNTAVIAISTDVQEGMEKTMKKSGAPFPVLMDENNEVIKLYGVDVKKREGKDLPAKFTKHKAGTYAIPSTFIIDVKGIIRFAYIGKSFTDRPSNEQIIQELKELQNN